MPSIGSLPPPNILSQCPYYPMKNKKNEPTPSSLLSSIKTFAKNFFRLLISPLIEIYHVLQRGKNAIWKKSSQSHITSLFTQTLNSIDVRENEKLWMKNHETNYVQAPLIKTLDEKSFKDSPYSKKLESYQSFIGSAIEHIFETFFDGYTNESPQLEKTFLMAKAKQFAHKQIGMMENILKSDIKSSLSKINQDSSYGQSIALSKFLLNKGVKIADLTSQEIDQLKNEAIYHQIAESQQALVKETVVSNIIAACTKEVNQVILLTQGRESTDSENKIIKNYIRTKLSAANTEQFFFSEFPLLTKCLAFQERHPQSTISTKDCRSFLEIPLDHTINSVCYTIKCAEGPTSFPAYFVHMNQSKGIYELYDPKTLGLWTFANKETLIESTMSLLEVKDLQLKSILTVLSAQ